jgi:DUF4097 and DUF4098 domain-containing protein YvlB
MVRISVGTALIAALLLPNGGSAQEDDHEWLEHCRERRGRDLVRVCDVRVERFSPPSGAIRVDPGSNGGVAVEGWSQNQIEVHARIEARAETEREARELASRVSIETDGTIRADGPRNERDANWHVSFVVYVPARSDLDLTTQNGPLSVKGVRGRMQLASQNGPISLREVGGEVQARAQNGPVSVALSGSRWDGEGLDAETRNGPIHLTVPDSYNADLETGTVNGPFVSDLPLTVTLRGRITGPMKAKLGDGGPPVRVVTTNGPVHIRSR